MQPTHPNVTIRALSHIDDLELCEEIQRAVWGFGDLEVVAASHLSAAVHVGGLVAGAFHKEANQDILCGFVYGFPAYERSSVGLHSHMMAVLPNYQGRGVGQRLKGFQRDWCLQRGLRYLTWTFDPLQAKNAKLNLEHLGASASHYLVNPYGALGGDLNGALPSDRLVAYWNLEHPRVKGLEINSSPIPLATTSPTYALHADTLRLELSREAPHLYVAAPEDINILRTADANRALEWRLAQREAFSHLFARGYVATRFIDRYYVLTCEE